MSKQRITYLSHYHYGDVVYRGNDKGWISAVTFTMNEDGFPLVMYEVVLDTKVINVSKEGLSEQPRLALVH